MKFVPRRQLWMLSLLVISLWSAWWLSPVARAQWQRWRVEREITLPPRISTETSVYEPETQRLTLRGQHFDAAADITLLSANGQIAFRCLKGEIVGNLSVLRQT